MKGAGAPSLNRYSLDDVAIDGGNIKIHQN